MSPGGSPVPTIALSRSHGPLGTRVTVSGWVPAGLAAKGCRFVRVTEGRAAGGAASNEEVVPVRARRYQAAVTMWDAGGPDTPAPERVVGASCLRSRDDQEGVGEQATAAFMITAR